MLHTITQSRSTIRLTCLAALLACLAALSGCSSSIDRSAAAAIDAGAYGSARLILEKEISSDRSSRDYILSRMRLQIATLADGEPRAAEEISNEAFSLLRTQGINADKTVASVVLTEGVKIWKGEPFEQAMSFHYIALQKAMLGEWDNARTAAQSSLFLLKDFGENEKTGQKLSTLEIAQRAQIKSQSGKDDHLDKGYTAVKTDFALGYLLTGIASLALDRRDEAIDNLREAAALNPGLQSIVDTLSSGDFNTILVVDYGKGPRKRTYGPDNALARFEPITPSSQQGLRASVSGGAAASVPPAHDVNTMAANHMWNNMEDVRQAKSAIGTGLLVGGVVGATQFRNRDAQLISLGVAAVGLLLKATSGADTRHLELLPQRIYVVPVSITAPDSVVTLEVGGDAAARLCLAAMSPPAANEKFRLRYVKLPGRQATGAWASSGQVLYANEQFVGSVPGDDLPFIMGGRCVKRPTLAVLEHYQRSGHCLGMTPADLENIYRDEGIIIRAEDDPARMHKHILEGGDSLAAPLAGTVGYARVFGQIHPPYKPRSKSLRSLIDSMKRPAD